MEKKSQAAHTNRSHNSQVSSYSFCLICFWIYKHTSTLFVLSSLDVVVVVAVVFYGETLRTEIYN
jgi:hypothetical protein